MTRPMRLIREGARVAATCAGWHGRPDFMIIGAQKSGTTALDSYLRSHPRLCGIADKEVYFFSPEVMRDWTGQHRTAFYRWLEKSFSGTRASRLALKWYHSRFPVPRPGMQRLYFDATPDYISSPGAPDRIKAYRPEMKFIAILRNPVERAYSAWNMFRNIDDERYAAWRETRPFEDAVDEEIDRLKRDPDSPGTDYVRRGFYEGLGRYLQLFPHGQVLVLETNELRQRQEETLARVCDFLGVPRFQTREKFPPVFTGTYDSPMPDSARMTLAKVYAPSNKALFEKLGRTFDWDV